MDDQRFAVVIPTYEPDRGLDDLLGTLIAMGQRPIVVDDGSSRPPVVKPDVEYVQLPQNRGIAAALNAGVRRARNLGATHVITLDQDSMVESDYVTRLSDAWREAIAVGLRPGVLAPGRVSGITYRGQRVHSMMTVPEVMQSGAMFSLEQLKNIGDFDGSLVIDCVDTDVCLRLRAAGRDVIVAPLGLSHRLGRAQCVTVGRRTILLTRHPPFRDFYMVRNRVLTIKSHGRAEPRWALVMARRTAVAIVLTAALDNHRWIKVQAMARGLYDGLRGRRGPLAGPLRRRWAGSEGRAQQTVQQGSQTKPG